MTRFAFLLVALITACAHGSIRVPARAADPGARLVRGVWYNPNPEVWRHSYWFRADVDMVTPMRVVISSDESACIMDMGVDEPREGEFYTCPTTWRYPQRRGP